MSPFDCDGSEWSPQCVYNPSEIEVDKPPHPLWLEYDFWRAQLKANPETDWGNQE